jgi:hypothetical protein
MTDFKMILSYTILEKKMSLCLLFRLVKISGLSNYSNNSGAHYILKWTILSSFADISAKDEKNALSVDDE